MMTSEDLLPTARVITNISLTYFIGFLSARIQTVTRPPEAINGPHDDGGKNTPFKIDAENIRYPII